MERSWWLIVPAAIAAIGSALLVSIAFVWVNPWYGTPIWIFHHRAHRRMECRHLRPSISLRLAFIPTARHPSPPAGLTGSNY